MRSKIFKLATIQSPRECHHPVPCNHSQASTIRPQPSKLATKKSPRDRQHHVLTIVRVPCVHHSSSTQLTSCAQNHASSCSPCARQHALATMRSKIYYYHTTTPTQGQYDQKYSNSPQSNHHAIVTTRYHAIKIGRASCRERV